MAASGRALAGAGTALQALNDALSAQHGRLFLYVPILLSIGIGSYFSLTWEPGWLEWTILAGAVLAACLIAVALPRALALLPVAVIVVACGAALAGARAHWVAAPVLEKRLYGEISGRIVRIDRSASDHLRLTLDQVTLPGIEAASTPRRVRVALHGGLGDLVAEPGLIVQVTGHLSPPPAPSEPGGFDFRRMAWFDQLGAVGYTRRPPVLVAAGAIDTGGLRVHRLRMSISAGVQVRLPGDAGAFAAAILTGDRSAIPHTRTEELRRSNLAHLLAISGLHMGLLTGIVYGMVRLFLALVPWVALRVPGHKIAAMVALCAGAFYLLLSGGNVATERAFIMVAVMLGAVLADRRAISLRSVALAAVIILCLRPEALLNAGFQMSFAATIALVAVFRALRDERAWRARIPRWLWPVLSLVLCSLIAGIATAPVAAASFNRLAEYGLIANLAAVPLMGLVIMPSAVVAALLWPLGLDWVAFIVMEPAILWVLHVSAFVSGLEGAVVPVRQPASWVLPAMALSALWVILWQGRARWAGAPAMALALLGWSQSPRPDLLIAPDASVVGLMGADGRILSRPGTGGFVARAWLQADGDAADQAQAHARSGAATRSAVTLLSNGTLEVVHLSGKQGAALLEEVCLPGRVVVLTGTAPRASRPCRLFTTRNMWRSGAVSINAGPTGLLVQTERALSGTRPWTKGR